MTPTYSQVDQLKQMLSLEQRRSELQGELDSLVEQLDVLKKRIFSNTGAAPKPPVLNFSSSTSRGNTPKRAGRGLLKAKITAALESAGSYGVKVKELAAALGTKPVNIYSWFHSALKRDNSITKLNGGHYRLTAASGGVKPTPVAVVSKPAKKRSKGMKRGQLTADILATLKAAGSSGITVADIAKKLGANYKNIYIWFATTGKKQPVKKLAPATYSLA